MLAEIMDDSFLSKQNLAHVYRQVVLRLTENGKTVDDSVFVPAFCDIANKIYPKIRSFPSVSQMNSYVINYVVTRAGAEAADSTIDGRHGEGVKKNREDAKDPCDERGGAHIASESKSYQTKNSDNPQTFKRVRRVVLSSVGENRIDARNVHSIKLTSAVIPNTEYTVSKRNNRMYFKESTTEDAWKMIELDVGDYETINSVIIALMAAMNKEGKGRYNFVVDKQTGRITIICSFSHIQPDAVEDTEPRLPGGQNAQYKPDSFQCCFGTSAMYPEQQNTLGSILGFDIPQVYNGVVVSPERKDAFYIQSPHPARLPAQDAVVVQIDEIPDMKVLVPLHADKGKAFFYCPKYAHRIQVGHYENVQPHDQFLPNIGSLTLKILNTQSENFDLRGAAPAVELEIESIDFIHNR